MLEKARKIVSLKEILIRPGLDTGQMNEVKQYISKLKSLQKMTKFKGKLENPVNCNEVYSRMEQMIQS